MNNMLVPRHWEGLNTNASGEMQWLQLLPSNTWCSLWRTWFLPEDLPQGYDCYVISYHLEALDINWILRQCKQISAPIILLSDFNYYDFPVPENLHCFTYIYWHRQTELISQLFPNKTYKHLRFKASSVCNRITQSKLIAFTTLAEELGNDALQILGTWSEDKNVHITNNNLLDYISNIFWKKYFGKEIRIDNFDNSMNNQYFTGDPWTSIYQDCAIHFTNESYHYSSMDTEHGNFIHPGPFLTEKTLKCLVGATGFISVGQFDTYRSLSNLGFNFKYNFDLSFDQDPGNLTRLEKIVKLIISLKSMSVQEIFEATQESSLHNQDHILSGEFSKQADLANSLTKNLILQRFGS